MSGGGINLEQEFVGDGDDWWRQPDGTMSHTYSRPVSATNSHYRPDAVVTIRDSSRWRAPTPYYHTLKREKMCDIQLAFDAGGGWTHGYSGVGNWSYATNWRRPFVYPQKLEDRNVNRALLKLNDDSAGLGEDFATWQQTADMVGDKKSLIASTVKQFKRKYPLDWLKVKKLTRLGRKAAGAIPGRWLELQYGWIPALADVDSSMKVIAERLNNNSGRRHVQSRLSETETNALPPSGADWIACAGQPVYPAITETSEFYSDIRFDFAIGNPALTAASNLGLANPAQLAWNLLPYSFVVDWFLPVDDFLGALSAPWGLHFIGGSITRFMRRKSVASGWVWGGVNLPTYYLIATNAERTLLDLDRRVLDEFPGPRMPHFKNPLSLAHLANGTSLLASAFK